MGARTGAGSRLVAVNILDGILLVSAALACLMGWRIGLVTSLVSLLAVVAGGSLGFLLGRQIVGAAEIQPGASTLALMASMIVGILLAEAIATRPAQRIHDAVSATRLRTLNSLGGATLTLGFVLAVTWMLATALALAPSAPLAALMRGSAVLVGMDRTLPTDAGLLFNEFERSAGLQPKSRVFSGLGLLPVPDAEPPAADQVSPPARRAAEGSVVRILGRASCGPMFAGSGAVVSPNLVLTNAHVVAGVADPVVFRRDRTIGLPAVPVYFDPALDVALLRVPDLDRPAIPLADNPAPRDVVAVAGYPNGGSQELRAALVRGMVKATGRDIYGAGQVQRQVLVIAGDVIPGDSGGPLLSADGEIVGLTFAAALESTGHTGYALSASEVGAVLDRYEAAPGGRVSTGACVPEE